MTGSTLPWRKSSRSGPWTDNCVQVAFSKSSHSVTDASCVEVAPSGGYFVVRDSKMGDASPELWFTESEWVAFIEGVKINEFDPARLRGNLVS